MCVRWKFNRVGKRENREWETKWGKRLTLYCIMDPLVGVERRKLALVYDCMCRWIWVGCVKGESNSHSLYEPLGDDEGGWCLPEKLPMGPKVIDESAGRLHRAYIYTEKEKKNRESNHGWHLSWKVHWRNKRQQNAFVPYVSNNWLAYSTSTQVDSTHRPKSITNDECPPPWLPWCKGSR